MNIPHSARDVIEFGEHFQRLLVTSEYAISKVLRRPLNKFIKGVIVNGFSRQIAERDLERIHKEALIKRARKTLAETVA